MFSQRPRSFSTTSELTFLATNIFDVVFTQFWGLASEKVRAMLLHGSLYRGWGAEQPVVVPERTMLNRPTE